MGWRREIYGGRAWRRGFANPRHADSLVGGQSGAPCSRDAYLSASRTILFVDNPIMPRIYFRSAKPNSSKAMTPIRRSIIVALRRIPASLSPPRVKALLLNIGIRPPLWKRGQQSAYFVGTGEGVPRFYFGPPKRSFAVLGPTKQRSSCFGSRSPCACGSRLNASTQG